MLSSQPELHALGPPRPSRSSPTRLALTPNSSFPHKTHTAAGLLTRVNSLLSAVNLRSPPIGSLPELQQSASSMFVAVFEAIFQVRGHIQT